MNEHELIQRLRQRDEPAFRWLVEHYRNKVFHTILNIVQDTAEAEDAAQETFIQVVESIDRFRQESSLSTWLYRIAVRKALDKTRRKKIRQRLQAVIPGWMPDEKKSGTGEFHHPGISLEQKEKAAVLFRAVQSLPEKQRVAFTLIKIQGLSYEEAMAILQQNIKAVESLVSRAKANLQKRLEQYYKAK